MVFNYFILILLSIAISNCTHRPIKSNPKLLYKEAPFISHAQDKTPYLAMNIYFPGVDEIRNQLEERIGKKLKHRGEAHITIITPPEYEKSISGILSMSLIDEVAQLHRVQQMPFKVECVGSGKLKNDSELETFFLVVSSPEIIELRKKINDLIKSKNQQKSTFDPEIIYPHITLGFTQRDLHLQDGVTKDKTSCVYSLENLD